jgi:hypothetical protein
MRDVEKKRGNTYGVFIVSDIGVGHL